MEHSLSLETGMSTSRLTLKDFIYYIEDVKISNRRCVQVTYYDYRMDWQFSINRLCSENYAAYCQMAAQQGV